MPYITKASTIQTLIDEYALAETLWVDIEVADYQTRKPRLSLIQILDDPDDLTGNSSLETLGDRVAILDVLDQPELTKYFIDKIMVNPEIEKIFHNSSYDLKFLGKTTAQNVTCTLEIAKQIPYYLLPVPNLQLKTLAEQLCGFPSVSKEQQGSDWGQRPLTANQLRYAKMDVVYLSQVDHKLIQLKRLSNPNPDKEDLVALTKRYLEIEQQWKRLDTELTHLQDRLKKAMQAQNLSETNDFKLSSSQRTTKKVAFDQLAKLALTKGIELDFPVTLTQNLQKELKDVIEQLPVEEETTTIWRLMSKQGED